MHRFCTALVAGIILWNLGCIDAAEAGKRRVQKSDLPFGSEFSPSQIELAKVLELAKKHGGDWRAFEASVYETYFKNYGSSEKNRRKLANNTKLGMIAYGVIERDATLTELGDKLYALRENPAKLHEALARHILRELLGMTFVQTVLDMQIAGETVTHVPLREWLEERGVHVPRGGKHPSVMRLWLEKSGVFLDGWRVNRTRLQEVLGASLAEVEALAMLSGQQKAYLKALANIGGPGPYASNEIEMLARASLGIKFNEKSLPKDVLYPLREAGYIDLKRGTKKTGRGAKPFLVTPTEKFDAEVLAPLLKQLDQQIAPQLRPLLRKTLAAILTDLDSKNRYDRGLALEALAFKLMRLVDLHYVGTRVRGEATAGAEVDLLFEGARLLFSRWQVQCKNTKTVDLNDVAREVGLTRVLNSNVIVIVTTGRISSGARKYANEIMKTSNLNIVMIDGRDLSWITDNPPAVVDVFKREAEYAMEIKELKDIYESSLSG